MASKSTTRESSIEKYFVKKCKGAGIRKCIKMVPTYENGIPDRMALLNGVSGFAEIKAPGKKPRPLQVSYMRSLEEAGFFVGVVDSKESALRWIEEFKVHVEYLVGHVQETEDRLHNLTTFKRRC